MDGSSLIHDTVLYTRQMRTLGALLAFASSIFAQSGKAELSGRIQDPAGLAIARAAVTAEERATTAHFIALSDSRGEYHLLGLPAGQYRITVEQAGFRPYR